MCSGKKQILIRFWIICIVICFICTSLCTVCLCAASNNKLTVLFIDCGEADAALVECDGKYMLIDGGNRADSQLIYSVLKKRGVTELAYVVASHTHEDHIGGLPGAYNLAKVATTFCNTASSDNSAFADLERCVKKYGGGITVPEIGSKYKLGSADFEFLGMNAGGEENDNSLIVKVSFGQTSFLFVGDAETNAENALLNSMQNISASVLKVGHHGSSSSTSEQFLASVNAEYAVISVGKGNSYGHPTDGVLQRLYESRALIYRTDLHGDIEFNSDGKSLTVKTVKKPSLSEVFTSGAIADPVSLGATGVPKNDAVSLNNAVGTDYIGNQNSMVFHYATCNSVSKIKEGNKFYYTGSRDELLAMGYKPCGNCHP